MKPTIAFLALGTASFSPANEREVLEGLNSIKRRALNSLSNLDVTMLDPFEGVIRCLQDVHKVIRSLASLQFDGIIIFFASWAEEELASVIASESIGVPKLLWGVLEPPEMASVSGVLSTCTNLNRMNFNYDYVVGNPGDTSTATRIDTFARAAAVANKLKRARIGVMGYPPPGMMDVTYGEAELKQLGPTIAHVDLQSMLAGYEKVSSMETSKLVEEVKTRMRVSPELSQKDLEDAVKVYLALREIISAYKLDAIAVRCYPELYEKGLPVNFAFSKLSDEGVSTTCEADLSVALTQLIMSWLSGRPVASMDVGPMSYEDNTVLTFHCTTGGTSLAGGPDGVRLSRHGFACGGVQVDIEMKQGRVTLAKLAGPVEGKFKMILARGEIVKSVVGVPPGTGQFATVRLDGRVKEFMDAMIKASAGHHIAIGQGDISEELMQLCKILPIQVVPI